VTKSVWWQTRAPRSAAAPPPALRTSHRIFARAQLGWIRKPRESHTSAPVSWAYRASAAARPSSYIRAGVSGVPRASVSSTVPDVPHTATPRTRADGNVRSVSRHAAPTPSHQCDGSCSCRSPSR